jgi:hypothetical protein
MMMIEVLLGAVLVRAESAAVLIAAAAAAYVARA